MITNLTPIQLSITLFLFTLLVFLQILSCTESVQVVISKFLGFEQLEREESIRLIG